MNEKDINKLAEEYQHENDYLVERIQSELIPGQIRTLIKEIWKDGYTAAKGDKGDVERLKEGIIKSLCMNEQNANEPYLLARGKSYTRPQIAEEINNNTDFGNQMVNNMLMLALDLIARGKEDKGGGMNVDWSAMEKEFRDNFAGAGNEEEVFSWFRNRPEFQLRQNSDGKNLDSLVEELSNCAVCSGYNHRCDDIFDKEKAMGILKNSLANEKR